MEGDGLQSAMEGDDDDALVSCERVCDGDAGHCNLPSATRPIYVGMEDLFVLMRLTLSLEGLMTRS
jgi:hypothetical protein